MLTLKDIARSINVQLKAALPQITIQSMDISEGFERPSLFVDFESVTTAAYMGNQRERVIRIIIYYFPTDRNAKKIELLEAQEAIEQAFSGSIQISAEFAVTPQEVNSEKVDGVLQTSFELYLLEHAGGIETESMEDLQVNINQGE